MPAPRKRRCMSCRAVRRLQRLRCASPSNRFRPARSMMPSRVYLDHNAGAPLRAEARDAIAAALEIGANPSSVHAPGRAARAVIERARGQVAALAGVAPGAVVFTSGATEANNLALKGSMLGGAA